MSVFIPVKTWDERWMIGLDLDKLIILGKEVYIYYTSSYNVIGARLLGFSYGDFLRYCRAKGALLKGKEGYTHPVWKDEKPCKEICNELNREWSKIVANLK